jgi:hypothetical protein
MFRILKSLSVMKVGPRPLYNRYFFLCREFYDPGLTRLNFQNGPPKREWCVEDRTQYRIIIIEFALTEDLLVCDQRNIGAC